MRIFSRVGIKLPISNTRSFIPATSRLSQRSFSITSLSTMPMYSRITKGLGSRSMTDLPQHVPSTRIQKTISIISDSVCRILDLYNM